MELTSPYTEGEPGPSEPRSLRGLLPALLLVTMAATVFGVIAIDRRSLSASTKPAKTQAVAAKRELPPGVTEDDVVVWVPIRQPSGRTELVPWTSVDAATARDPLALEAVLNPAVKDAEAGDRPERAGGTTEPEADRPATPTNEAARQGLLARIRDRVLGIEARADAPGDAKKVTEDVGGGGGKTEGAALAVDPGDRRLDDATARGAGDR